MLYQSEVNLNNFISFVYSKLKAQFFFIFYFNIRIIYPHSRFRVNNMNKCYSAFPQILIITPTDTLFLPKEIKC